MHLRNIDNPYNWYVDKIIIIWCTVYRGRWNTGIFSRFFVLNEKLLYIFSSTLWSCTIGGRTDISNVILHTRNKKRCCFRHFLLNCVWLIDTVSMADILVLPFSRDNSPCYKLCHIYHKRSFSRGTFCDRLLYLLQRILSTSVIGFCYTLKFLTVDETDFELCSKLSSRLLISNRITCVDLFYHSYCSGISIFRNGFDISINSYLIQKGDATFATWKPQFNEKTLTFHRIR